ncbi:MAG: LssY C-terminal domain-containing protein [Synechococcaceae cyanobacterium]|nr:LssY C-terminal domain-containing protein [Synechococcaceae cyanobacterium]
MLVGPPEAVFPALARRGWHVTQQLTLGSFSQTIESALLGRRYRYSPMAAAPCSGLRCGR